MQGFLLIGGLSLDTDASLLHSAILEVAEEFIQAPLLLWPYGCALKGCRAPLEHLKSIRIWLTTGRRISADLKFRENSEVFGRQWLSVIVPFS